MSESVVLTVLKKPETVHKPATLLDVSRSGFRVLVGLELLRGTRVLITLNAIAILGQVQHCRRSDDECFLVGVQILQVLPSAEAGLPDGAGRPVTLETGSAEEQRLSASSSH